MENKVQSWNHSVWQHWKIGHLKKTTFKTYVSGMSTERMHKHLSNSNEEYVTCVK